MITYHECITKKLVIKVSQGMLLSTGVKRNLIFHRPVLLFLKYQQPLVYNMPLLIEFKFTYIYFSSHIFTIYTTGQIKDDFIFNFFAKYFPRHVPNYWLFTMLDNIETINPPKFIISPVILNISMLLLNHHHMGSEYFLNYDMVMLQ